MKFTKLVAMFAIISMAASAMAEDGTLRRTAQDDNSNGIVILNTNTNSNTSTSANTNTASAQPTTIVEASPVVESKAEVLRKERQNAEVQTEQRIVEKLEDSRLQEEKARADRLFGNKLDAQPAVAQPVVQPVVVAPVVAPVAAPVVAAPVENRATQVTIEKVEIIQPREERKPEVIEVNETKIKESPIAKEEIKKSEYYVSGLFGNLSYNASNVKNNYGLGFAAGMLLNPRMALEFNYFYSNAYVDTFWQAPLYRSLDQSDYSLALKYSVLSSGMFRPYIGGQTSYIYRSYTDRIRNNACWAVNQSTNEATGAVNMAVLGGVDLVVSDQLRFGAGINYSFNVMNTTEPNWVNSYNLPQGTVELEKISFYTIQVGATYTF